ncbi:hypothetical protein DYB37_000758 [Aphanomyces astaci]|uniref:Tim44-like domain-containing protein n=1 Tax=Aphanomyces astaci TaxID=112090 RepID=A0A397DCQ3_APHAT|nr:hypothetical protein DYB25_001759 [Aphanomyces astaci]RHY08263.1 hypothetical protein DYB36_001550 [Aphanomyces astaci]RHY54560.1 hypothetical protein DYB38_000162 [Aphanomyces astaci]RHY62172.1 hypothetical protein DYB30_001536 [Aphanomyces astaci]RHY73728.1 hypothetical protein DYB34_001349 [Aphanomyces astaci]
MIRHSILRAASQVRVTGHARSNLPVRHMSFFSRLKEEIQAELNKDVVKETTDKSQEAKEAFEKRAKQTKDTFEETLRQAKTEASKSEYYQDAKSKFFDPLNDMKSKVVGSAPEGVQETLKETLYEVFGWNKKKSVEETLTSSLADTRAPKETSSDDDDEAAATPEYTGTTAMVVVKGEQTAWERVASRLRETPIIQGLLDAANQAAKTEAGKVLGSTAKKARDKVGDATEDVREYWETSQNPWVYRMSSIYDGLFGETPESIAIKEIRRADPSFDVETWKDAVAENVVPHVLDAFLRGNSRDLKQWMGEAAYNTVNMAIRERKADGLVVDPNILAIRNVTVIALSAEDKQAPIIGIQLMAQQINCIRNREGEIVEGADDDIQANFYIFAFRREYDEEASALKWKIVEFGVIGSVPYI